MTIPIVDLTDSYSGHIGKRKAVAAAIRRAAIDTGFFYVANHDVPKSATDAQLSNAQHFFALPAEVKSSVYFKNKGGYYGYEGMLTQTLDLDAPADLKESFMITHESPVDGSEDAEMNQWPEGEQAFRTGVLDYSTHMVRLGRHLVSLLALSLDLPEDYFAGGFVHPSANVRMLRYPPQPTDAAARQMGSGAHTDWGFITILLQDGRGGLEVRSLDGDWIRATPVDGTFVINLGDMIPRLTNGTYHSNFHRVLNNVSGKDRYSVATFFNPSGGYPVACVPTCLVPGEKPLYEACTASEHIAEMFQKTYGRNAA